MLSYLYGKYKYSNNLIPVILPTHTTYEDGTDRVFRNVGIWNSDAGESPKRKNTTFRTRRKFEIKANYLPNQPTKQLTNNMKKSPSWDSSSSSVGQKYLRISRNLEVHDRFHNSPLVTPTLSQIMQSTLSHTISCQSI